ncbi:MAG: BON domain-containing protein, partial [Planctomycetales bacterium]|nr:BON domain-containing protein [Planctomycetales bacterium]
MRRFLFGVVIASVTAAMPAWAFGGDREIAKSVIAELQQHKAAGNLKGFDIDLKVEDGVVYLTGEVANRAQRAIVEQAAVNQVGQSKL